MSRLFGIALLLVSIAGAAQANGYDDAAAALKAQDKGDFKKAIALYQKAISDGDLPVDQQGILYSNIGNAYTGLQKNDEALAAFNKAIELNPGYSDGFNGRGVLYSNTGHLDLAIADYSKAWTLDDQNFDPLENRAFAYFYGGQFANSAADFELVVANPEMRSIKGRGAEDVIQLYVAGARAGTPNKDELSRNAAGLDVMDWPGPMVAYLLGTATEAQIRAEISKAKPKVKVREACDFDFYLAETRLIAGDAASAKPLLAAATDKKCFSTGFIYKAATGELRRL